MMTADSHLPLCKLEPQVDNPMATLGGPKTQI